MSIQLKHSLTAQIDPNYVLAQGQVGIEMPSSTNTSASTFKLKIGDGSTKWSALPYEFYVPAEIDSLLASKSDTGHTHSDYLSTSGTAAKATQLATSRTIQTNLASTSSASFNGTANVTPGITGTLPVSHGGTGVTTLEALKTALGVSSSGGNVVTQSTTNRTYMGTWGNTFTAYTIVQTDPNKSSDIYYELPGNYPILAGRSGLDLYASGNLNITSANNRITLQVLISSGSHSVQFDSDMQSSWWFIPDESNLVTLGKSDAKWKAVYAQTGTIQTSDRSSKHAIHYLSEGSAAMVDENGEAVIGIGLEDVIEFINSFEPVTFLYNSEDDTKAPDSENRQLGLIADDIENTRLFPYVGGRWSWEARPAELDHLGNVVRPEISAGSTLGLKAIPLAVAALTACKYLLQRVEMLEEAVA